MGLFGNKPAWMSRNLNKSAIALRTVTDPSELIVVATNAPLWSTRSVAISKLKSNVVRSDNEIRAALASIAQRDSNQTVRAAATIKLNKHDPTALAQLATTSTNDAVRMEAVEHLRDKDLLDYIALNDSNNAVRALAQNRIGESGGRNEPVYNSFKAATLYGATELLRGLPAVPPNTYYVVETPDGNLGRDIIGFYTETPLKTVGISLEANAALSQFVDAMSLTVFYAKPFDTLVRLQTPTPLNARSFILLGSGSGGMYGT